MQMQFSLVQLFVWLQARRKDERRGRECEWTAEDLDHGKCSRAMAISVCDGGGILVGGPRLAVPTLEGRTGSLRRTRGEKGSPGLLTPNRPPIENQSSLA